MLCYGQNDTVKNASELPDAASAMDAFTSLATQYRESFNERMRHKMALTLTGVALFLMTMIVGIFHFNWFSALFEFMESHSEIEDPIVFIIGCGLIAIVAVLVVYIQEAHHLQNDITHLMEEKDKLAESYNRRQRLESLGTIASGISHEINTALQSILGGCELARNRIDDPEACLSAINRAINSSLHARRIIDNVLTFSSVGGRAKMDVESVTELLQETAAFCQTFLPPSIDIQVQAPASDFPLAINRTGIIQAINNLVSNSAHASDYQGTVILSCESIRVEAQRAEAMSVKPGLYASLTVTDFGAGISPEHLIRIFDPFYTTKKEGEGTGLGLSMVHGLVRSMNGFVDIASEVGTGTRVQIFIPKTVA
jgi:signal transduction histidine kinase